jgi:hypothetical protein
LSVSIQEQKLNSILIYPNPTSGSINIDLGEILVNPAITLTNNLGQVVFTKNFDSTNFINIDTETPKEIYFSQIQTKSGRIITRKIVKE